jgi:GT2 family glycosyltransferase
MEAEHVKPEKMDLTFPPDNLPETSLIICSRNRPVYLFELVSSILEGDELPSEIVIIDDSETPNELLNACTDSKTCQIRYIWNHSRGLSRANNLGISQARYDLIVFTQDDVLVAPTWFGTIVRSLIEAGKKSIITGQVQPGEAEVEGGFAPSTISSEEVRTYCGRIGADVLYLQNSAFYRSVVTEVGGFDPRIGPGTSFPSAEDNDFGFRALEAGYTIIYDPRAITFHRAWRPKDHQLSLSWDYGRGQGAFYAKHLSFRDLYMFRRFMLDLGNRLIRFPKRIILRPARAVDDLYLVLGILSAVTEWFLKPPKVD